MGHATFLQLAWDLKSKKKRNARATPEVAAVPFNHRRTSSPRGICAPAVNHIYSPREILFSFDTEVNMRALLSDSIGNTTPRHVRPIGGAARYRLTGSPIRSVWLGSSLQRCRRATREIEVVAAIFSLNVRAGEQHYVLRMDGTVRQCHMPALRQRH